jgi:vacuolar protein sorting-associated protein 29
MVPVLVIGDLHIPHRVHDLPPKFKKLLVPSKIQQILCTGNICDKDPETYDYMRTISPDVHAVKGDYDESAFPLSVASVHNPMIGMIHGPQYIPIGDLDSLSSLARQMDVDRFWIIHIREFLQSGAIVMRNLHSRTEFDHKFFVNPG